MTRKVKVKPTRRTWLLVALAIAALGFAIWVMTHGRPRAEPVDAAEAQARAQLTQRFGSDVELLYVMRRSTDHGPVVCGYFGTKAPVGGSHNAADYRFLFERSQLVVPPDNRSKFETRIGKACPNMPQPLPPPAAPSVIYN